MTERYSFSVDRHLVPNISVDGSVVWSQDNMDNTSLTDTINEGYVTAEEETQYLSVLDATNEISLENLNITLTNPKLEVDENADTFITSAEEQTEQAPDEGNEQQVVVYSVEGSEELYGIQIAQDDEGNLQKYQFQFRKNKDGQLEAIPETIQLLPMEDDEEGNNVVENIEPQQHMVHDENVQHAMHIYVQEDFSNEHILPDNGNMEPVDIKPRIVTLQNVKEEDHHQQEAEPLDEETSESYPEEETEINKDTSNEQILDLNIDNTSVASEENSFESESQQDQEEEEEHFEHIEVNPDLDGQELDESDVDDNYHVVEGVHITGDFETLVEEPEKTNILRHALKTNKETKQLVKRDNRLYLYVVQHPEKENVDSFALGNLCTKPLKANPRSILKSSFQAATRNESDDAPMGKRFARCKEAVQARIFHNFINKTTIPQAPVRKDRLPRKQKIKPVDRMDEEIVVQEVMVSNNGFVEARGDVENLQVTEYVELTDSDDDYDPKRTVINNNKKKKKHKRKKIEITTISDDDDSSSDSSVIELDASDDEEEEDTPTKRRRGRPPKATVQMPEKPEIPCPKCEKTFPSQNSLKTHLQHHNLQNSLKNFAAATTTTLPEKYKCANCTTTFKNAILMKKHACFSCSVCKKKFPDQIGLNVHKRIHAKEQLLLKTNTCLPIISPAKKGNSVVFKSPKKIKSLKCKTCNKLCSSLQNLNLHVKTHKEYICATCCCKFLSQLALEKHLRENCVKSPQGARRSSRLVNESKKTKVSCDKCSVQFYSHQMLFKHKVKQHGLHTPDKSVLQEAKKTLHKEKKAYGGIPAASKLQDAYTEFRCQLDFEK